MYHSYIFTGFKNFRIGCWCDTNFQFSNWEFRCHDTQQLASFYGIWVIRNNFIFTSQFCCYGTLRPSGFPSFVLCPSYYPGYVYPLYFIQIYHNNLHCNYCGLGLSSQNITNNFIPCHKHNICHNTNRKWLWFYEINLLLPHTYMHLLLTQTEFGWNTRKNIFPKS